MGKRRILLFLLIIVSFTYDNIAAGIEILADRCVQDINEFLKDKISIKVAITEFENYSEISDLGLQKFYQMLSSRLETLPSISFQDISVQFSKNKGIFNFNEFNKLDYYIYLKLIRHLNKMGLGVVIFSKLEDKVVHIAYLQEEIPEEEIELLNVSQYGFEKGGFSKIVEMEAKRNLLDFKSIRYPGGEERYFLFFADRVDIFEYQNNSFHKLLSFNLDWGRPYTPVLESEGRLSFFFIGQSLYIGIGANFSLNGKLWRLENDQWTESSQIDFVPLARLQINGNYFLLGSRYEIGKNYFQNKLIFVPFQSGRLAVEKSLEKTVPNFYAMDFLTETENLDSVHLIDTHYNYQYLSTDFKELFKETKKKGASLSVLDKNWLAMSDYLKDQDRIYFYKKDTGPIQAIYEADVPGEIRFISSGFWNSVTGFWLYLKGKDATGNAFNYKLQFWSKSHD